MRAFPFSVESLLPPITMYASPSIASFPEPLAGTKAVATQVRFAHTVFRLSRWTRAAPKSYTAPPPPNGAIVAVEVTSNTTQDLGRSEDPPATAVATHRNRSPIRT